MTQRNRLSISTQEPTRYQVALAIENRPTVVVGYTARKSRAGLFAMIAQCGGMVLEAVAAGAITREAVEGAEATYRSDLGALLVGPVSIYFTGRTERDAAA